MNSKVIHLSCKALLCNGLLWLSLALTSCHASENIQRNEGYGQLSQDSLVYHVLEKRIAEEIVPRYQGQNLLNTDSLYTLLKTQTIWLVDVRESEEYEVSVLPGAITLQELEQKLKQLKPSQVPELVFYCTIGWRSGDAAEEYSQKGYTTYNLLGGVLSWSHENLPFEHNGQRTDRVHVYSASWNLLDAKYFAVD